MVVRLEKIGIKIMYIHKRQLQLNMTVDVIKEYFVFFIISTIKDPIEKHTKIATNNSRINIMLKPSEIIENRRLIDETHLI